MAKKPTAWQSLGLTPVKNAKGTRIGFNDKEGNYIPERQFRKLVGTPIKGSQGYKERKAAKEQGKDFRPSMIDKIQKEIQKAAKLPGMTLQQFTSGKEPDIPTNRTTAQHNKWVDDMRRQALEFKKTAGVLTSKQVAAAEKALENEIKWREKAADIMDSLSQNKNFKTGKQLTRAQRKKLAEQYRTAAANYNKAQSKVDKLGLISRDESAVSEALRYGYYH